MAIDPGRTYLIKGSTLETLLRRARTILTGAGLLHQDLANGDRLIYLDPKATFQAEESRIPFEVYSEGLTVKIEPGVLAGEYLEPDDKDDFTEGTWTLWAKVVIDPDNASVVSADMLWLDEDSPPADTASDFHTPVAQYRLFEDDTAELDQYLYGPINILPTGGNAGKWAIIFI
jgi:hypothetical protein